MEIVGGDKEAPLSHALGNGFGEALGQVRREYVSIEVLCKGRPHGRDFRRRFVHELETDMAKPGRKPTIQSPAGFLRFGAEDSIATADICQHGMGASAVIT